MCGPVAKGGGLGKGRAGVGWVLFGWTSNNFYSKIKCLFGLMKTGFIGQVKQKTVFKFVLINELCFPIIIFFYRKCIKKLF